MRYYLDTNILVFLRTDDFENLSSDVRAILEDSENVLYTSSECVQELIHIVQIGKVRGTKRDPIMASGILDWLIETGVELKPVTSKHLQVMSELPLREEHHDPFDRLIIAQAISDRIPVITSDRKFALYKKQGLELVFNER